MSGAHGSRGSGVPPSPTQGSPTLGHSGRREPCGSHGWRQSLAQVCWLESGPHGCSVRFIPSALRERHCEGPWGVGRRAGTRTFPQLTGQEESGDPCGGVSEGRRRPGAGEKLRARRGPAGQPGSHTVVPEGLSEEVTFEKSPKGGARTSHRTRREEGAQTKGWVMCLAKGSAPRDSPSNSLFLTH